MFRKSLLSMIILMFITIPLYAASYTIDSVHSQVHFTVPHLMMFKVRGNFDNFNGSVEVDTANQTLTKTSATVDAASIDTDNEKRDKHLRSADFFDVAKYPEMTFVSKKISGSGDAITVTGDLTIRGVTREVVLTGAYLGQTKDPQGNSRTGFEASGKIDRRDFGLTWNKALEAGGVVVGDEVEIGLEVAAVKEQ